MKHLWTVRRQQRGGNTEGEWMGVQALCKFIKPLSLALREVRQVDIRNWLFQIFQFQLLHWWRNSSIRRCHLCIGKHIYKCLLKCMVLKQNSFIHSKPGVSCEATVICTTTVRSHAGRKHMEPRMSQKYAEKLSQRSNSAAAALSWVSKHSAGRVLMKSSEQSRSMRLPITCQVKAMNVQQGLVFATEQTSRTPWLNVFIPLLLLLLILLLLRLLRLLLLLVNASAFDRGKSIRASWSRQLVHERDCSISCCCPLELVPELAPLASSLWALQWVDLHDVNLTRSWACHVHSYTAKDRQDKYDREITATTGSIDGVKSTREPLRASMYFIKEFL